MADPFLTSILSGRPATFEPQVSEKSEPAQPVQPDFLQTVLSGKPVLFDEPSARPTPVAAGPDKSQLELVNRIRRTSAADLSEEDDFDPVGFITQNEGLANDPVIKKKLIDVARARHEKPFSLLKFGADLPGATVDAVKSLAVGGVKATKALFNTINLDQRFQGLDTADALKSAAELGSSVETAAVQDADLGRRAARAVVGAAPTTDQDFEKRLFTDAEFRKQIDRTAEGEGEALHKYFDTDAKQVLEAAGLKLDPKNVREMSVATDLLNFIPAGAALRAEGKAFRLTDIGYQLVDADGKLIGNVATRGTRLFKVIDAFNNVVISAPKLIGDKIVKAGEAVRNASAKVKNVASAGGLAGALVGGADAAVTGGLTGIAAGIALPRVGIKLGEATIEAGKKIRGEIPPGRLYKTAAGLISNPATRGAAAGLGLNLPKDLLEIFAREGSVAGKVGDAALAAAPAGLAATGIAAADTEQEAANAVAGQAGIGGLVGLGAAGARGAAPYFDIAGQALSRGPTNEKPVASPGYGSVPALDTAHDAALAALPQPVQNRLNALRELVRPKNAEIYVLPSADFGSSVADYYRQQAEAGGVVIPAEKLAEIANHAAGEGGQRGLFVDNLNLGGQKKKVIFLNQDGGALSHETGHLFDSLFTPEERSNLRDLAYKTYSPEEQIAFKQEYDDALRKAAPDHPGLTQGQLLDEIIAESISAAISGLPIEKLGTPKPLARAIYQKLGNFLGVDAGKTDLGLRKDLGLIGVAENLVRAKAVDEIPIIGKVGNVDFSQVNIGQKPAGIPTPPTPAAPSSGSTVPPAVPAPGAAPAAPQPPNIRATRAQQDQFRGRSDGLIPSDPAGEVKTAAEAVDKGKYTPKQKQAFVKIGATLTQGGNSPAPLEVIYNSIKTDKFKAGRRVRKGEQDAGYAKEQAGAVPSSVRMQVQKVIVPNRVEVRGGEVILHAFSLDKVIENIDKVIPDAVAKGAGNLIPYAHDKGQLTPDAARQLVKDIQDYTRNQSNGYAGNGKPVVVPPTYYGQIPAQNAGYTPVSLPNERAQFINVLLAGNYGAGAPPKTTRKTARTVPANISARELATANNVPILPAAASKPGKNFFDAYGVEIAEFNPIRDQLFRKGVDIDNLGASNEVLKLSELEDVKVRNDLDFSRPSTDLIRAGFQPDPRKPVRQTNEDVAAVADGYTKKAGIEYTPFAGYETLSPELGKQIADWFDSAKHEPNAPAVNEAYNALVAETKAQYEDMVAAGYTIEPFTGKGEPYSSSADMVADVRNNKHLYFLPTDQSTFGSSGKDLSGNPLLQPSGIEVGGRQLLNNDLFRAVHDFFGHAKQGYEFGPRGEYNAFLAHSSMFTPEAIPALGAETLAQNAWVNFGKHLRREDGTVPARGDKDFVPLNERPFADQKNTVVPGELLSKVFATEKTPSEQRAAVKGSFAPEMSPEKRAAIEEAAGDPKVQWRYTVQKPLYEGGKGLIQIDAISGDRHIVSASLDDLRAAGADLPNVPDHVPQGQYTLPELQALIEKGPPKDGGPDGSFAPATKPVKVDELEGKGGKFWLSPDGEFFPITGFETHEDWARKSESLEGKPNQKLFDKFENRNGVGFRGSGTLYDKGWLRVTSVFDQGNILTSTESGKKPSPKQNTALREAALFLGAESVKHDNGLSYTTLFHQNDGPEGSFLPFQAKTRLPEAVRDESIRLIHYGTPGMREADPIKFGKSGKTSQSELAGEPRSFFYEKGKVNKSDPVTDRADLYETTVSGDRIYDGDTDSLGYADMVNRSKADQMLQDKGYVGIARSGGQGKRSYRQVELFEPVPVQPTDHPKGGFSPDGATTVIIRPTVQAAAPTLTIRPRKDDEKR